MGISLLLDTYTLLWALESGRLSVRARSLLQRRIR